MADEHTASLSVSSTTAESLPIIASQSQQSSTNDIISTESLIFQNSSMASVLSSATNSMLPQDLITIQGLDNSEATASFTVSDIVASSGSAMLNADHIIPAEAEGLGATEYQLVDNGNGELIVITSTPKASGIADIMASSNLTDQTQTITLNLEEATQLLLQQQGLSRTVQLPDGSLQIMGNSLIDKDGLPLEVLQTLQHEFAHAMPTMESSYGTVMIEGDKTESKTLDTVGVKQAEKGKGHFDGRENKDMVESGIMHTEMAEACQAQLKKESDVDCPAGMVLEGGNGGTDANDQGAGEGGSGIVKIELITGNETNATNVQENATDGTDQSKARDSSKEVQPQKEPDLNSPIPVTDQTIVMIKGKKCVLAFNEETQQMCAYPIKPPAGTKRRGRPKMSQEEKEALAEKRRQEKEKHSFEVGVAPSEKSSAAETLLELSSVGADGVRRSARKRKKAKLLEEYEELEDSDEEEPFVDNQEKDPDITMHLPDAKKKKLEKESIPAPPAPLFTSTVAKRGRGRPRRYPPPGQSQIPTSIPAVIIPSPNGQTLVMADIQNLRSLQRQLPNLVPKPPVESSISQTAPTTTSITTTTETTSDINLALGSEADPLHLDSAEALDNQNMIPTALQGDTLPLVGSEGDNIDMETADNNTNVVNVDTTGAGTDKSKDESTKDSSDQLNHPTVIQIPENLLPMLGIKKDPIKIGLKASERELEKLKCPKCDFQGFYAHQYRAHIATHGEDIRKCKCCSYVSLDSDELLAHFKEFHPRCICPECDFMAEHAYIIKRHMMRHNAKSCTCQMCGKVYKDTYILKMHVKMVHMPAEVLFECNVCSKKFTRKAHLKRHLRIHEPEKPFKCPHCEYRGCERSDISKHMLIHEEPKHVCERCGKTFRHIKNKELHVKRHFGQRDYKCGVCDFFGYTFTDIRKHIERKHQDMKTLICDKCNKHFRSEMALKEHQQICNVMMIEQILAIPTSSGGTSQATIQIPTILGPDGQRIILDSQAMAVDGQGQAIPLTGTSATQAISVDGKSITMGKPEGVNIVVSDQQLGLAHRDVGEDEELLELEDEESEMEDHMQIIGETIMTESGEQIRIISQDSLVDEVTGASDPDSGSGQIVSIAGSQVVIGASHSHNVDVDDGEHGGSPITVVLQDHTAIHIPNDNNAVVVDSSVGGSGSADADMDGTGLSQNEVGHANVTLSEMRLMSANLKKEQALQDETGHLAGVAIIAGEKEGLEEEKSLEENVVNGVKIGNTETVGSLQSSSAS